MTTQRTDLLHYRGRRYAVERAPQVPPRPRDPERLQHPEASPLDACTDPATAGRRNALRARALSSLWRGYRGTWAVRGGRLWLVGLDVVGTGKLVPGMEQVFPGSTGQVLADWFTGEMVCPLGDVVQGASRHTWWAFRVLHFERGQLVRSERRDNSAEAKRALRDKPLSHDDMRRMNEMLLRNKAEGGEELNTLRAELRREDKRGE